MKHNALLCSITLTAAATLTLNAAPPAGYYDSLNGKSGVELKKATKEVALHHIVIEYGDDTWEAFEQSDTRLVNGEPIWWDMYSNERVKTRFGHASLNIEHGVANSWWGGLKNMAYKDLFHLNPSNSTANNQKGNYPLGEIATVKWDNGVTFVGTPKSGFGGGCINVFEPIDYYKGDFARAYFYIFTVYDGIEWKEDYAWMYDIGSDLMLQPWAYNMLLQWANEDPVSQKEYNRNEAIYLIQNNRNPFIDCPELAEHIWGTKSGEGFIYGGDFTPAEDPDLGDDEFDDSPTMPGRWRLVTDASELDEDGEYCLLETGYGYAMSYNFDSSKKYLSKCELVPEEIAGTDVRTFGRSPEDMAIIKLKKVDAGYALGVYSFAGEFYGYIRSTTAKAITLSQNANDAGCAATLTVSDNKTDISYGSTAGRLQYNKTSPRFTTYTSNQGDVALFKLTEDNGSSGIGNIDNSHDINEVLRIYDINGRQVNAMGIDDLDKGLYIIVTPAGSTKIVK